MSEKPIRRVALISLGCPKNQVDSELILGRLAATGAEIVEDPQQADTLVVNTCSFIDRAREESVEALLEAEAWKDAGEGRQVIAAGCLVQRSADELAREIPAIDGFVGLDQVLSADLPARPGRTSAGPGLPVLPVHGPAVGLFDHEAPRRRLSPPWTAFVKIAEGCDQNCAFCAIPTFRGRNRSRSVEDLSAEVRQLAAEGVLEVNLIAQDSTGWGRDLGLRDGLPELLETLDGLEDAPPWIRIHYLYPGRISGRLLEVLARARRIVPYVDLPLQHAARDVLRRMRRPGSAESYGRQLEALREVLPDAGVRSSFIVGFPGETEDDFDELLRFVEAQRFDSVGVFTYSHEESTAAFALEDDIPAELKEERRQRLEELSHDVSHARGESRVGSLVELLVEGAAEDEPLAATARWAGQAPEVDGRVLLPGESAREPGRFIVGRIVGAGPLELVARVEESP